MRKKSFLIFVSVLTAFFFVMTSCGGDPYTVKVTYSKLTEAEVVAVVDTYVSNQKTYSSKWTVKRTINNV